MAPLKFPRKLHRETPKSFDDIPWRMIPQSSMGYLCDFRQKSLRPAIPLQTLKPLPSSNWGWGHQQQEHNGGKIRLSTIYGENPTTTRRPTTWARYNNMTPTQWRASSASWLPTDYLSPSEVRNIVDTMERNMVNSVETCFYNNVGIDSMVVDIDIQNSLRLRMLFNKRDASAHGCINSGHLTPQNNKGCFTQ